MTSAHARAVADAAGAELGTGDATKDARDQHRRALFGAVDGFAVLAKEDPVAWERTVLAMRSWGLAADVPGMKRTVGAILAEQKRRDREAAAVERGAATDATRTKIRARCSTTEKGKITACDANVATIIRHDPRWSTLRMSKLGDVIEVDGDELVEGSGEAYCCEWLRDEWGVEATMRQCAATIHAIAKDRTYSPVVDYLESVRGLWKPSMPSAIGRILTEVLGIKLTPDEGINTMRHAMIGRFLVSAVARAMHPGCRAHNALILVGDQGAKKSTFFATLFGPEFFSDSPIPIGDKDAPLQLSRVWGYEASELEDLTTKRSVNAVKQFMSTSSDNFRAPYAAKPRLHPRHTVLCGTSNPSDILSDPSGARRFWILTVPHRWIVPVGLLASLRDLIWSEALHEYGDGSGDGVKGEPWWFAQDEDDVRDADSQQYVVEDPWQGAVESWLSEGAALLGNFTTAAVLKGIGLEVRDHDQRTKSRVMSILRRLGWDELNSPSGFRHQRVWRRREVTRGA